MNENIAKSSPAPVTAPRSRRWGRRFIWLAVILLIVIGSVYYTLSQYLTPERIRTIIITQTEKATGRALTINGDVAFRFGLKPKLEANDIAFANAPWAEEPSMVTADALRLSVDILPLLSKQILLEELVLERPVVQLATNQDGVHNWEFETGNVEAVTEAQPLEEADDSAAAEGSSVATLLKSVQITDGLIRYTNQQTGEAYSAGIKNLGLTANTLLSPLNVVFAGHINNVPAELEATLPSIASLANNSTEAQPVIVQAAVFGVQLAIEADVNLGAEPLTFAAKVKAESADMNMLASMLGEPLPPLGTVTINFTAEGTAEEISIPDWQAKLGDANFKGTATITPEAPTVRGTLDVALPSLAWLNPFTGQTLPDNGSANLKATYRFSDNTVDVSKLALSVADSSISGSIKATLPKQEGAFPAVVADLQSPKIVLAQLLPQSAEDATEPPPPAQPVGAPAVAPDQPVVADATPPAEANAEADTDLLTKPLPWPMLADVQATVKLVIDALHETADLPAMAEAITLDVRARDGRLQLINAAAGIAPEGRITASGTADAATQQVALKVSTQIANLGAFLTSMGAGDTLRDGKIDVQLDATGSGATLQAILASLNGTAALAAKDGVVANRYMDYLAQDLLNSLIPWRGEKSGTINCVVSNWPIENGIATTNITMADTGNITIAGTGAIDLGQQRLNLRLVPRPKDPSLISIATPILVRGKLASPSIGVDVTSAAGDVLKSVALGAINPAALLIPFLSTGTGDEDPCSRVLQEQDNGRMTIVVPDVGQPAASGQPVTEQQLQQTLDNVKTLPKDIEKTIKENLRSGEGLSQGLNSLRGLLPKQESSDDQPTGN